MSLFRKWPESAWYMLALELMVALGAAGIALERPDAMSIITAGGWAFITVVGVLRRFVWPWLDRRRSP